MTIGAVKGGARTGGALEGGALKGGAVTGGPWPQLGYTLACGWYASALDFCAHLGLGLVYIR